MQICFYGFSNNIFSENILNHATPDLNDCKSTSLRVMSWCHQSTSYYQNQYLPSYLCDSSLIEDMCILIIYVAIICCITSLLLFLCSNRSRSGSASSESSNRRDELERRRKAEKLRETHAAKSIQRGWREHRHNKEVSQKVLLMFYTSQHFQPLKCQRISWDNHKQSEICMASDPQNVHLNR